MTSPTDDLTERLWRQCTNCHGAVTREVNRRTGEYLVVLPTRCETKDECERAALRPFVSARSRTSEGK